MKALEGVKIIDMSTKLTSSLATMYLCQYGAEVIKIEPPEGDPARKWDPIKNGESVYFNYLNSGKKSVIVDYRAVKGVEILKALVKDADVFCIDLTPAEAEKYGLTYDDIREANKDIIYSSYSYMGYTGPEKDRPASSLVVQAMSVAMDMTGFKGEEPVHVGPSVAEHYAAGYIASGIVMALIDKKNRGIGQQLDVSLLDSIFSCIEAAPAALTVGEIQRRKGNEDPTCAPYDSYKTNDGYVAVGVATQAQWVAFCEALGFDDFLADDELMDPAKRLAGYETNLKPRLAEKLEKMSKFDVEAKARTRGVPCGAVLRVDEVLRMPNTIENRYMDKFESGKFGTLDYPMLPFTLSVTPAGDFKDAPSLDEDADLVAGLM